MNVPLILLRPLLHELTRDTRLSEVAVTNYERLALRPMDTMRGHVEALGIPEPTLRRSLRQLIACGWAEVLPGDQDRRSRRYALWMPLDVERRLAELLQKEFEDVPNAGEALMHWWLDLLVADFDYADNARPRWLIRDDFGGRFELDRWYRSADIAFEFQGAQHFGPGGLVSMEEFLKQRLRDELKAGICIQRNIRIVHVTAQDLNLSTMLSKVQGLPLAPVRAERPLIVKLGQMSQTYLTYALRRSVKAARSEQRQVGTAE